MYWTQRLSQQFGEAAAPHLLNAFEGSADVLPGIQRLVWLGNDNHTVVAAGITVEQLQKAPGIPFLPLSGVQRIGHFIEAAKSGKQLAGQTPGEFLAQKASEAEQALRDAQRGAQAATRNRPDAQALATDLEAVTWVARFYRDKLAAAVAKALFDAGIDREKNRAAWLRELRASVSDFRKLTELTERTYESLSDVPAWHPTHVLPCPYHWSHVLTIFERESAQHEKVGKRP